MKNMSTLKKTTLFALSATALAATAHASAFTAFQSSGPQSDTLLVSGRVAYEYDWHKGGTHVNDHNDGGSRTNLSYTHAFSDSASALAVTEWGYDPFFRNGPDRRHHWLNTEKRLQFVGGSYKGVGTLTYGKQDSVYTMITDATDQFWIFGGGADGKYGDDSHLVGTDRPNRSVKYKNAFGDVTVGAMYGANDHDDASKGLTRHYFGQGAVNWQVTPNVTLGTAYNHTGMAKQGDKDFDIEQWVTGATWTPGNWTLGVLAGQYHNKLGTFARSRGYETFTQYSFNDAVSVGKVLVYGGLNRLEDRDSSARASAYILGTALQTHKGFGAKDNFLVALEHVFNDSKDVSGRNPEGADLDATSLLVRYNY